jgi:hypothetical protein
VTILITLRSALPAVRDSSLGRLDENPAASEDHRAVAQGKEGVVATLTYVEAWQVPRAALPDQDGADRDLLARKPLYSQEFGARIPSVLG